jgi:hypothetical protein
MLLLVVEPVVILLAGETPSRLDLVKKESTPTFPGNTRSCLAQMACIVRRFGACVCRPPIHFERRVGASDEQGIL